MGGNVEIVFGAGVKILDDYFVGGGGFGSGFGLTGFGVFVISVLPIEDFADRWSVGGPGDGGSGAGDVGAGAVAGDGNLIEAGEGGLDLFFGEFIGVDHSLDLGGNVLELVACSVVVSVGGTGEGGEGVALGGVVVGGDVSTRILRFNLIIIGGNSIQSF